MSTTSTALQNLVEIHPRRASGQTGELQLKNFLSNSPTGETAHHIFTPGGSNDADSCKGLLHPSQPHYAE